eukprot:10714974-Ditylum_brightwellii.AAC.1
MPYTQLSANHPTMMPPLQLIHMQTPPATIRQFNQQPFTQQHSSPNNELLSSQGSLEYQGDHLTQNNHIKHKMDLGADGADK